MAEIKNFLDPKAQEEIKAYINSLEKIAGKYKTIAENSVKLEKSRQDEIKSEKLLIQKSKESEKLTQAKIKTQKDEITLTDKLAAKKRKEAKETEKQSSAYQKLNKQLLDARNKAKDLGAQYGKNDKRFKSAQKEVLKLDKNIKKLDSSLGQNQRGVGGYLQSLVKFAGQLGLVTGAAALLKKGLNTVKESILSIQTTGDKFVNTLAGIKEGYNSFIRSIATGTSFANLIKNFRDAVKVGKEYSLILDDLGDRQRAIRISQADTRLEQEKLLTISRDVSKSDKERLSAIDKYIKLEADLIEKKKINAQIAYNAELLVATNRSKLNKEQVENYLKTYGELNVIETEYAKKQQELKNKLSSGGLLLGGTAEQQKEYTINHNKNIKKIESDIKSLNIKRLEYYDIIQRSNQLDDTIREKLVKSYEELIGTETNSLKSTQRVLTMRGSLLKKLKEEKDGTDDVVKSNEAYLTSVQEIARALSFVSVKDRKSILEKLFDIESLEIPKDLTIKVREASQELLDEINATIDDSPVSFWEKILATDPEVMQNALSNIGQITGQFFDLQSAGRERDLQSLDAYYQTKINAASNHGENTEKIEREYKKKRYDLEVKQAKADKAKALTDIAINTAIAVSKVWGQTGILGIAAEIPVIAMGILQAAIVAKQPLPQIPAFFMGTESTPDTFIAGDKGTELGITKEGEAFLTPNKATLYSGMEGTQIIPNDKTLKILNGNISYYGDGDQKLGKKLDDIKGLLKGNKPVINIINKYDQKFEKRYNSFK